MTEQQRPDAEPARANRLSVTVTRTGGIAGAKRTWQAQPETADAGHWAELIDRCPWDAADPARPIVPTGADRLMWHVGAVCGPTAREAALPDTEVQGPWRELIDAVRAVRDDLSGRTGPSSS